MADCFTTLNVKNVDQNKFGKWFNKETYSFPDYDSVTGWDFHVEVEGGYGGFYWEALAFKMISKFEGIEFDGCNQVVWADHLVKTIFKCDGETLVLTRGLELPSDYDDEFDEAFEDEFADEFDDEIDDMRAFWEAENEIPYLVKFSVEEALACTKGYKVLNKKLKDEELVKTVCAEQGILPERLVQYATILNFMKR